MQVNHGIASVDVLQRLHVVAGGTESLVIYHIVVFRAVYRDIHGVRLPNGDGDGVRRGTAVRFGGGYIICSSVIHGQLIAYMSIIPNIRVINKSNNAHIINF